MGPTKGIVFRLCAVMCFVVMFSLIKATADSVPAGQAVFYRSLFALPIIVAWLFLRAELRNGLKVKSRIGHFWRSLFGTCAMSLNFAALGYLPLPDVTAIGYLAPLLTIVFAALFLKERLRLFRTVTIGIGFLGVLVVIEPRVSLFSPDHMEEVFLIGVALVLTGAVFAALAQIQVRRLVQHEHPAAIAFYFAATSTILSLFTYLFGWVSLSIMQFLCLTASGVIGGIGQICLTLSYRHAQASLVAPFEYASILFALLIGYTVFHEVPSVQMLIGVAIIVAAGLVIIWREAQIGLEHSKATSLKIPPN